MNEYRYQLDKSSKKFPCPKCEERRFVRFVDNMTNEYLPHEFGRCDREISCAYFMSPFSDESYKSNLNKYEPRPKPEPVYIPKPHFEKSQSQYYRNNFVTYLNTQFDRSTVKKLIQAYKLGTSRQLKGGCIFYQIDLKGNIRRGKIIVYNPKSGRRGAIHSVHSQLGINRENYPRWRFFGEHLLIEQDKPVAIVESEKTAIIASVYFPQCIWLATGNISTLKPKYAQSLRGRCVTLFPDIRAYDKWLEAMKSFQSICEISISDLLEKKAGKHEKKNGFDLADYLIQHPLTRFK